MEPLGQARVCIDCVVESGGDATGLILGGLGLLISIGGAVVSVLAFRATGRNHDALIFREEFERHRLPLETALKVLTDKAVALTLSNQPGQLWPRIEANFMLEQSSTLQASMEILQQARQIDARKLFKKPWEAELRPLYDSLERQWDQIDHPTMPETLKRLAAKAVTDGVTALHDKARTLIEEGVRAPLARKRWTL